MTGYEGFGKTIRVDKEESYLYLNEKEKGVRIVELLKEKSEILENEFTSLGEEIFLEEESFIRDHHPLKEKNTISLILANGDFKIYTFEWGKSIIESKSILKINLNSKEKEQLWSYAVCPESKILCFFTLKCQDWPFLGSRLLFFRILEDYSFEMIKEFNIENEKFEGIQCLEFLELEKKDKKFKILTLISEEEGNENRILSFVIKEDGNVEELRHLRRALDVGDGFSRFEVLDGKRLVCCNFDACRVDLEYKFEE